MFNVAQFSSHINSSGILHTNLFSVEIPIPNILRNGSITKDNQNLNLNLDTSQIGRMIEFRVVSTKVPGVQISVSQHHRYGFGPIQKSPTNAVFEDIPFTFIADANSLIFAFFTSWFNSVFAFDEQPVAGGFDTSMYRVNYRADYAVDIVIIVYDSFGRASKYVKLIDAWPIEMRAIPVDWTETNHNMQIEVVFTYRDWRFENVTRHLAPAPVAYTPVLRIPERGVTPFFPPAAPPTPRPVRAQPRVTNNPP